MTDPGEAFRGSIHCVAGHLFAIMAAYNAMRAVEDGGRRHVLNAAFYASCAVYEARQTYRHWVYA